MLGFGNLSQTKATTLQPICSFVARVVCAIQRLGLTPLPVRHPLKSLKVVQK